MKKIVLMSALNGFICCFATAQTMPAPEGKPLVKVCRATPDKKIASCYNTKFSENYKVCKNSNGYYICSGVNSSTNIAYSSFTVHAVEPVEAPVYQFVPAQATEGRQQNNQELVAPQSQSYPANTNTVPGIGTLYNGRKTSHVCYQAANVADENRLPYQGCPSPQDDGPDKNNARNVNESNPINQPPLTGRSMSR